MRVNQPVTQREYDFPSNTTLMSTTDPSSHVVYANAAFVEVSGFTREEIVGSPHNFVRHPDMPKEAFADMWATMKCGEPWTALVKNRRKDGDHYWVRANAVPIIRNGRIESFMSVRTKPSREEIAGAEALYKEFREGKAGGRKFHKGIIVRTGLLGSSSVERVEVGSHLADDAGKKMADIVFQVKRVTDLIGEINSATLEQNSGIAQVGQAIGNIDQITQQNAALVEQSAAASMTLRTQAEQLVEAVGVFR